MSHFVRVACALFLLVVSTGMSSAGWAAVEVAFYSRELGGNNFPHAFVTLRGDLDSTGEPIDASYGFTAKTVSPALLFGSVAGEVITENPAHIARSDRQFAFTISDAQYRALMEVVEEWRTRPQPSYHLNRRNCVHFVGELAAAVGLRVDFPAQLMKRPRSYLQHLLANNAEVIARSAAAQPAAR
jgi:hypothetical protein